jgi:hypothetical protein
LSKGGYDDYVVVEKRRFKSERRDILRENLEEEQGFFQGELVL